MDYDARSASKYQQTEIRVGVTWQDDMLTCALRLDACQLSLRLCQLGFQLCQKGSGLDVQADSGIAGLLDPCCKARTAKFI